MSQAVEIGGNSVGDVLEDVLRSRTARIVLVLTAVIITVLGFIVYKPEVKPGIFGKIWAVLEAYWYGFDVITSKFIEDEALAKLTAFIIRTGFTTVLVLSLLKPLFDKEGILKFITYLILLLVLAIVVYVALSIMSPAIEPIGEAVIGWLRNV